MTATTFAGFRRYAALSMMGFSDVFEIELNEWGDE